jgi:hypothetical protein
VEQVSRGTGEKRILTQIDTNAFTLQGSGGHCPVVVQSSGFTIFGKSGLY